MPADFDLKQLFEQRHWHQRWELFENIFTPGRNDVASLCDAAGLPKDLRGLRVLDIGAWHGCFSFECERRGASEVVALCLESDGDTGFHPLAKAVDSKVVRCLNESVYNLDRKKLGEFDLVLFFGVLYHLRYPLLALDKIRTVCRGTVLVESHVIDNHWMTGRTPNSSGKRLSKVSWELCETPIWRYYHNGELMGDASNYFGPNVRAVVEGFESAGFAVEVLKQWADRATFRATVQSTLAHAMRHSYEMQAPANRAFLGID
jgi:tRNA (mo5U34)-methyltransferase